jgi:hypothetical protein
MKRDAAKKIKEGMMHWEGNVAMRHSQQSCSELSASYPPLSLQIVNDNRSGQNS